jgi:RNA polymerase sigma-70 factor (ECF subfamily)
MAVAAETQRFGTGVPPTGMERDLTELAARATGGDPAALDDLLRELQPTVVRAVRLTVGPGSAIAEDAAQEAMISIARAITTLRDPGAVRGWAMQIAMRRALRSARRERFTHPLSQLLPARDHDGGRADALAQAFDRLPPRLRATAVLRLFVGLSEAETASVLGCAEGTVKSQLHDARRRLSDALERAGYAPATKSQFLKEVPEQ